MRMISSDEKILLERVSAVIRRKLLILHKNAHPQTGAQSPVTLTQLRTYLKSKPVPLCDLISLLRFYGCSENQISEWNITLSAIIYRAKTRQSTQN